jgi:excisionase family DNA binding protein
MDVQGVLAVGVNEAAKRLGVSPRTVTSLVRTKAIVSRKIGRRRVIPVTALEAFLRRDHESSARHTDGGKRQ